MLGRRPLIFSLLLSLLGAGIAQAGQGIGVPVQAPPEGFDGGLLAGASADGKLFLLDSIGRGVFVVDGSGKARLDSRLPAPSVGTTTRILRAQLAGGRWFLQVGAAFESVEGDRVEAIPSPRFLPVGLGAREGSLVLQVEPTPIGQWPKEDRPQAGSNVPWLVQWDGTDWKELVSQTMPDDATGRMRRLQGGSVHVASDAKGRIYTAHEYRYRLAQYSSDGRLQEEVLVGKSEIRYLEGQAAASAVRSAQNQVAKQKMIGTPTVDADTGIPVMHGLTVGSDGISMRS